MCIPDWPASSYLHLPNDEITGVNYHAQWNFPILKTLFRSSKHPMAYVWYLSHQF
jgi:hypothetical protein